jgi:hypothetical protein
MTLLGFLPKRWRPNEDVARHAETIVGVLHTAPIEPSGGGPSIVSTLGTAEVLPYLVAIKSLHRQLGRGRVVIVDDGTLTGEDRAILAHHCGDPEIVPHSAVRRGSFPADALWAGILTVLDRRNGQYWIMLDPHTVTRGPVPEIEQALASNRSLSTAGNCHGIAGFAAGAGGRALAAAFMAEFGDHLEPDKAADFLLSNEPEAIELPAASYAIWRGRARSGGPALIHFPARHRYAGNGYATASAAAIDALPR